MEKQSKDEPKGLKVVFRSLRYRNYRLFSVDKASH